MKGGVGDGGNQGRVWSAVAKKKNMVLVIRLIEVESMGGGNWEYDQDGTKTGSDG